MIVVLDTNVWVKELGLRSALGAQIRFLLRRDGAALALPEVVRRETIANLRAAAKEWMEEMQKCLRCLAAVRGQAPGLDPPDSGALHDNVARLFDNLGLETIPTELTLATASAAFGRTISKTPPSVSGGQFKDCVLWEDCLGLLQRDDVCLVTEDKGFYEARDHSKGIAGSLREELASAAHALTLLPDLRGLLDLGDLRAPVEVDGNVLEQAYMAKHGSELHRLATSEGFELGPRRGVERSIYITEDPGVLYINCALTFDCDDVAGEGRTEAELVTRADCWLDTTKQDFVQFTPDSDRLNFTADGERKGRGVVYGYAGSVRTAPRALRRLE